MSSPIPLRPVARPVDPDVVERLREVLAMAERGEVIAVAVATVNVAGCVATAHVVGESWAPLVAAVATLQHRLIAEPRES